MLRSILPLTALAALVVFSGCADYGGYYGNQGSSRYPGTYDNGRYDDRDYDDYRTSGYYRPRRARRP